MKDFEKKFNLIYIPYLLALVACMIGYSVFDWFFYIGRDIAKTHDRTFFLIGPLITATAVVLIWVRPQLRLITRHAGDSGVIDQFPLSMFAIASIAMTVSPFQWVLAIDNNGQGALTIFAFLLFNAVFLLIIGTHSWDTQRLRSFEDKRCAR